MPTVHTGGYKVDEDEYEELYTKYLGLMGITSKVATKRTLQRLVLAQALTLQELCRKDDGVAPAVELKLNKFNWGKEEK
jgi:hypothetical protein